jgi:hypothetical protein
MRRHDRESSRLGDDGRVRADAALDQRSRAGALVFLVGNGGDNDFSLNLIGDARGGRAHRGDSRLHVRRAAPIDAIAPLGRVPRSVCHSFDADDVEVAVEHQRPSARPSDSRHHVRPSW